MKINSLFYASWLTRITVGFVFGVNVWCAIVFIFKPQAYIGNFEITGTPGEVIVQSFGILFLMWNATYPPVILRPSTNQVLFRVILVQQMIGLCGEIWMWLNLPAGHPELYATGLRFIVFDGFGLLIMGAAYTYLHLSTLRTSQEQLT